MNATETKVTTGAPVLPNPDSLIDIELVSHVTSLSAPTIRRRVKDDPRFPQPVRLGTRCVRWKAGEITAWVQGLSTSRIQL